MDKETIEILIELTQEKIDSLSEERRNLIKNIPYFQGDEWENQYSKTALSLEYKIENLKVCIDQLNKLNRTI